MNFKNFEFNGSDGNKVTGYKWETDKKVKVKAVLQISHGMAEHAARYDRFAEKLNEAGYIVYANDHKGHGKTAGTVEECGFFSEENGWEIVRDDMYELTKIIKKENENLPVFLLGHSMGSFLSRSYVLKYTDEIDGVIISGSAGDPGAVGSVGKLIAKLLMKIKGPKTPSPLLDKMSFGAFNDAFKPNRTDFDWLSTVDEEVDKYIADPFCGNIHSTSYFYQLMGALSQVNSLKNIETMRKDLAVYVFSGSLDPVSNKMDSLVPLFKKYVQAGIKDVSVKFYGQCRHETLNEFNREEVYQDVINWLDYRTK